MPEVERPLDPTADAASDEPKSRHADYFIRAVGNAIDILELLSGSAEPVSLVQITELVGQSKSSVFRILCTLEKKGLLERKPGDQFTLSQNGLPFRANRTLSRLNQAAHPHMRELCREFRETVSLACLLDNHVEIVHVIESPQRIRMFNVMGGIIPPHASSVGKCIVAHQPETVREHLLTTYGLHSFTALTITDAAVLEQELRRVREQGFAVDREESTIGGCCFGAPIWTSPGRACAAISMSFPKDRAVGEPKIVEAVRRTAKSISDDLASLAI
jgi:IclR family transcriptional regulator, acetate operon repressor